MRADSAAGVVTFSCNGSFIASFALPAEPVKLAWCGFNGSKVRLESCSVSGSSMLSDCDGSCSRSHGADGACLVCGDSWGPHTGHNCNKTGFSGRRGSWVVAKTGAAASAAAASVAVPVAFAVGSRVTLAAGYESRSDASSGPLRPGDEGAVVELGDKRLKVQAKAGAKSGSSWWYDIPAIRVITVSGPLRWHLVNALIYIYHDKVKCNHHVDLSFMLLV